MRRHALFCDVDQTLLPSMSTSLDAAHRNFLTALHDKYEGAFALVTGRPLESVDQTFGIAFPASIEHHSGWRSSMGGQLIHRTSFLRTPEIRDFIRLDINEAFPVFEKKEQVLEGQGGFFIEEKCYSLALVFSPKFSDLQRPRLTEAIEQVILKFDLSRSHKIVHGSDAIELSPVVASKMVAVDDFMATENFKGRKPIFIGDSGTDAAAMRQCAEMYGGYGIAVGDGIPDQPAIYKRLNDIPSVWAYLGKLL